MKLFRLLIMLMFGFILSSVVACGGAANESAPNSSRSEEPEAEPTATVAEPVGEPVVYTISDVCTAVNNSLVTVTGELELPSFIS
ncbi:MAG: hypothetical protein GY943_08290, partial [Chloroflexi bacterium]|nr:hypothetical protein [Chloroflexota bacterium]